MDQEVTMILIQDLLSNRVNITLQLNKNWIKTFQIYQLNIALQGFNKIKVSLIMEVYKYIKIPVHLEQWVIALNKIEICHQTNQILAKVLT
jgi:hypothetical protein